MAGELAVDASVVSDSRAAPLLDEAQVAALLLDVGEEGGPLNQGVQRWHRVKWVPDVHSEPIVLGLCIGLWLV